MNSRVWIWLIVGALIAVAGYALWSEWQRAQPDDLDPAAELDSGYRFEAIPCWFAEPTERQVDCGRLHTPPRTGRFVLPVVIIRDHSPDRRPDPVVYVPGGPGGASGLSAEGIEGWIDWLEYADLKRDLILMDPRGTGYSVPRLECEEFERFSIRSLETNMTLVEELAAGLPVVQECFGWLATHGFDSTHYGTRISALDLAGLMAELDEYGEWNLLGMSYGTRVGLIVPEYTQEIRSLVLDSIYPPDLHSAHQWPELLGTALESFFEWCRYNQCYGGEDMQADFYRALESLRTRPIGVNAPRWDGKPAMWVIVNDHRLLSAVFSSLYSAHAWEGIASAISAVLNRDRRALTPLIERWINISFSDDFSSMVFMVVDCQDELVGMDEAFLASVAAWPLLEPYTRDLFDYDICPLLVAEPTALVEDWQPPALPTLLLAGIRDPITPAHWAEVLHQGWPGSQLMVRDTGHGVADSDPCILAGLREFLDNPQEPWQPGCD